MSKKPKSYWIISITDSFKEIFREKLPGNLSVPEVKLILQRLACRDLNYNEILNSSARITKRNKILDVKGDRYEVNGRAVYWVDATYVYTASIWLEDELVKRPDVDLN
jgi:hypothetical protein